MKMNIKQWIILGVAMVYAVSVDAHKPTTPPSLKSNTGLYVGAQAGMLMGESEFSSFANDRFRCGGGAGINAGYHISEILGVEVSANWGKLSLAEQERNNQYNFFIGQEDWKRYSVVPDGMDGYYYKELLSRVFAQRYGLHLRMNILGFFDATQRCGLRCELVPSIYATGTSSDVLIKDTKECVRNNIKNWQFGLGINVQIMYSLTEDIDVGIYGGITQNTGDPIDGLPNEHSANYIADVGVKMAWNFGRRKEFKPRTDDTLIIIPDTVVNRDTTVIIEPKPIVDTQAKALINRMNLQMQDVSLVEYEYKDFQDLKTKCQNLLDEVNKYQTQDKDVVKSRDDLDFYLQCIKEYQLGSSHLKLKYNKENIAKSIEEVRAIIQSPQRRDFFKDKQKLKQDLQNVLGSLENYETMCHYFAYLVNSINGDKDIKEKREKRFKATNAVQDYNKQISEIIKRFDADNTEFSGISPEHWVYNTKKQYIDNLKASPYAHSGKEDDIAELLGLDKDTLKNGGYTWNKDTKRLE